LATASLHHVFLQHLASLEPDGAGRIEIAEFSVIGPLHYVDALNRLRNDEIEIGVPLAMPWVRKLIGMLSIKGLLLPEWVISA